MQDIMFNYFLGIANNWRVWMPLISFRYFVKALMFENLTFWNKNAIATVLILSIQILFVVGLHSEGII